MTPDVAGPGSGTSRRSGLRGAGREARDQGDCRPATTRIEAGHGATISDAEASLRFAVHRASPAQHREHVEVEEAVAVALGAAQRALVAEPEALGIARLRALPVATRISTRCSPQRVSA